MTFGGKWRGNPFEGTADVGNVLSLRDLKEPFPLRLALRFARTSINAEGHVADIRNLSHIDAKVSISGPSLGTLYPTLPLALPETPPYRVTGRLVREGDVYTYTGFSGVIGNTDIAGDARYERRKPRPLLTATLKSRSLDLGRPGPAGRASASYRPRAQRRSRPRPHRRRRRRRRQSCRRERYSRQATSIFRSSMRWTPMCNSPRPR